MQKLRQFPTGFGDGCLQRTVDVPEIVDESRRLLAAFCYRGLVMVEFKRDPIDGAYVLMEINPRTVSGNQLGITAGVDLAWIAHRHLTADDRRPDETAAPDGRIGVQYVNEEWDTLAFLEARAAGRLGLGAWLRSLLGTRAWAIFAWNDPGPVADRHLADAGARDAGPRRAAARYSVTASAAASAAPSACDASVSTAGTLPRALALGAWRTTRSRPRRDQRSVMKLAPRDPVASPSRSAASRSVLARHVTRGWTRNVR